MKRQLPLDRLALKHLISTKNIFAIYDQICNAMFIKYECVQLSIFGVICVWALSFENVLIDEALALPVAQFVQVGNTGKLDHGRWTAHEDHRVITGWRQVLLNHLSIDEALTVLPIFRSSVHCEPEFEAIWMPRLNLLQLILQQNVLLSLVGKQQAACR